MRPAVTIVQVAEREGYRWHQRDWPSPAQRRILNALLEGGTNAHLAIRLGLSFETVEWHIAELLAATELADRLGLAQWWLTETTARRRAAMAQRGSDIDDLVRFVQRTWEVGNITGAKLLESPTGFTPQVVRVEAEATTLLVKRHRSPRHRELESLERRAGVADALIEAGLVTNRYLRSRSGDIAAAFEGLPVSVSTWVEGEVLSREGLTPALIEALGALLGRIHRVLRDYPFPPEPNWRSRYMETLMEELRRTRDTVEGREVALPDDAAVLRAIESTLAQLSDVGDASPLIAANPGQTAHGDFNPGNLLVSDSGVVAIDVMGWPEARIAEILYAVSELAATSYPETFDLTVVSDFVRGYASENQLSESELRYGVEFYRWYMLSPKGVLTNYGLEPTPSLARYGCVLVNRAEWLGEHASEVTSTLREAYLSVRRPGRDN